MVYIRQTFAIFPYFKARPQLPNGAPYVTQKTRLVFDCIPMTDKRHSLAERHLNQQLSYNKSITLKCDTFNSKEPCLYHK